MAAPARGRHPGNIEAEITSTEDDAVPQTRAVRHDPYGKGTTSGEPNTSTVRVAGSTSMLPSGFKALGVGRGAICITCDNTRNGAHNHAVTDELGHRDVPGCFRCHGGDVVLLGESGGRRRRGPRAVHPFGRYRLPHVPAERPGGNAPDHGGFAAGDSHHRIVERAAPMVGGLH